MSQVEFEQLMGSVMENMALHILTIGMNDCEAKGFETCRSGGLLHLRVKDSEGQVVFQVTGKDTNELGDQLVLACLQKISSDNLRAFHRRPLQRVLQQVPKEKEKGKGKGKGGKL